MSTEFYTRMREVTAGVMSRFAQGNIEVERTSSAARPTETFWQPVAAQTRRWSLRAVAGSAERRYVDDVTILRSTAQVTSAATGVLLSVGGVAQVPPTEEDFEFAVGDVVYIDSRPGRRVVRTRRVPEAGVAVATIAFLED